jgi:hypothetical protein
MITNLSAVGYNYNAINYTAEFQRVLNGIFICYTLMLKDNVLVPANDENKIRDILLLKYLKNDAIRDITGLSGNFIFDREVPEDNTEGRTDIKVQTIQTFTKSDAYYVVECKRLDNKNTTGTSGLNAEYIKNGIYRFVAKKYSTNCGTNAIIGFVIDKMDIHFNIMNNIKTLLKNNFKICNTIKYIKEESFIPNFKYHYSSVHNNIDNVSFTLYHLVFDFSNNIDKNT